MANILRNNIIIGNTAIKDLVVSNNSNTRQTVNFVKTVDQNQNIDIPYDTFEDFEYGDVVIDNVLYGEVPASGGKVSPSISYHQTIIYKGYSGLKYLLDVDLGDFVLIEEANPDYADAVTEGAVITFSGKIVNPNDGTVGADSLGTTIKPKSVIDTITVTVSLNGKTATKTVNVYQSANYAVSYEYGTPEFTNTFGYNTFGAVAEKNVLPSVAPQYKQSMRTKYASQAVGKRYITSGAGLTYEKINKGDFTNFTLNTSTGAITTTNRTTVLDYVTGYVLVRVVLNGKMNEQITTIHQDGARRWYNGNRFTPRDIVSMGLNNNGKDRLFIPKVSTSNPPLYIFRRYNGDALKFSGSNDGYILTGETNTNDYTEITQ